MILTVAAIKGGSGKSTTAAALCQAAASKGWRTLAVDLDPQASLSYFIGADPAAPGAWHMLHGGKPKASVQQTEQGIDAIAGSPDLAGEKTAAGSAKRLNAALIPLQRHYDITIVDTPPQMGELTYLALMAADRLLIPLEADAASLQGLYQIVDMATQMQAVGGRLTIAGSILTRYDGRPKINRRMLDAVDAVGKEIGAPLLCTIRPGIVIREAQALKVSLYAYAPDSNPATDYMALFEALTARRGPGRPKKVESQQRSTT